MLSLWWKRTEVSKIGGSKWRLVVVAVCGLVGFIYFILFLFFTYGRTSNLFA